MDSSSPSKGLLAGIAAVVIIGVVVIGSAVLGEDDPQQPTAQPTSDATRLAPSETAPTDEGTPGTPPEPTAGTDTPTPDEPTGAPSQDQGQHQGQDQGQDAPRTPRAARELAAEAIGLYTEYGYTDSGPYAWMDRIGKVSTGSFAHSLEETFAGDQELERYWDEVVATKRQTRTEVEQVALERVFADYAKDRMTFTVTYRTAVSTTETDGWTDPPRAMSQWVTVVKAGGGWKVADITTTQNRS